MTSPVISILMPVHNGSDTLQEAVESIRAQSCEDWELIAVDDGSTDASQEILYAYQHADPRVRCIARERCGIVEALNTAAESARGPVFARMDADDIAYPERLAAQAALLARDADNTLCGARVRMVGDAIGSGRKRYEHWINSLADHAAMERDLFVECPLPHPTFMLSRETFTKLGGYRDCGWPEDYDMALRLWQHGARFVKPEAVLLDWRNRAERLSMTDARYSDQAFRALKRHFLYACVLNTPDKPFYQWGAGEVGKKWLREWPRRPEAVVDINPRKIGRVLHHVPVIAPEQLPPPGACALLIAVGAPGARDEIRAYLRPRNYREPEHFRFIA